MFCTVIRNNIALINASKALRIARSREKEEYSVARLDTRGSTFFIWSMIVLLVASL